MSAPVSVVLRSLNRPQYVPTPETLISALAWDVLEYEDAGLNTPGWRYLGEEKKSRTSSIRRSLQPESIDILGRALRESGFHHSLSDTQVGHAVAYGIAGVRPTRGKGQAASPMTPSLALLQNPAGMTGAAHPANYASILDALYSLGSEASGEGVSQLWLRAAEQRVRQDPVLHAIDAAFVQVRAQYALRGDKSPARQAPRHGWSETPFGWFHDSWSRLTSSAWVSALPPRVWTDWATTVLRLALAMGFLWECERYSRVCRAALDGHPAPSEVALPTAEKPFDLVPWPANSLPVSSRNVRAIIKRKTYDGGRLRSLLSVWEEERAGESVDDWLREESFRDGVRFSLTQQDNPKYLQNLYETVLYSLLRRDLSDHYGLLSARGNAIAIVNPGTEWVAVVASLAAGEPGRETYVGNVVRELARLGLQPRLPDLIALLEAAGLARGSADADHGVRVDCAF